MQGCISRRDESRRKNCLFFFFFSSRRRHTRSKRDWSSDVCSSDLAPAWFIDVVAGLRASAKAFRHDKDLVLASPKAGQVLIVPLTYHQFFDQKIGRASCRERV